MLHYYYAHYSVFLKTHQGVEQRLSFSAKFGSHSNCPRKGELALSPFLEAGEVVWRLCPNSSISSCNVTEVGHGFDEFDLHTQSSSASGVTVITVPHIWVEFTTYRYPSPAGVEAGHAEMYEILRRAHGIANVASR